MALEAANMAGSAGVKAAGVQQDTGCQRSNLLPEQRRFPDTTRLRPCLP
jgi:hypothetical protein